VMSAEACARRDFSTRLTALKPPRRVRPAGPELPAPVSGHADETGRCHDPDCSKNG